jgi:AcrR family transcriptional regulator
MPKKNISAVAPKKRGRQRSVAAEAAILAATMKLLQKQSLREITADAIANEAGVSKATLYKWWPNKNLVALDAFMARLKAEIVIPDTGSAQKDFTQQLQALIAFYTSPFGKLFCQFLAEGQNDDSFLKLFRERFLKVRRDALKIVLQRGVARGELRGEVDSELALDLIFGPMVYRLMAGHAPLDETQAKAIVQTVFRGLQKNPR